MAVVIAIISMLLKWNNMFVGSLFIRLDLRGEFGIYYRDELAGFRRNFKMNELKVTPDATFFRRL
jgi:hypothetical protein